MSDLSAPSATVETRALNVWRDNQQAVRNVSLTLQRGEILSLVGPSGAGKSSILLALAGLIPYTGHIMVPERIGVVFQDHGVFPWLTVEQNVRFGLTSLKAQEKAARSQEVLELAGIEALAHRYPAQLSGGQRQRVAIARTLATRSELVLLDEPFASLDILTRWRLADWLRELSTRMELSILMVSHDLDEALRISDHVAVMVDGTVSLAGVGRGMDTASLHDAILRIMDGSRNNGV